MTMPAEVPRVSHVRLALSAIYVAAWPALMLVLGGDPTWVEGWLFAAWLLTLYAIVTGWLYVKDPGLLAERHARPRRGVEGGGQSAGDRRAVLRLFAGFLAWIVIMPLDAVRFSWSPAFPVGVKLAGAGLLAVSAFFLFRAFHDNTFLSGGVRIQSDRGQTIVTGGVYGFVRHPMYLGILLMFAGAPLLLGSLAALAVTLAVVLALASRIVAEEELLLGELAGYAEYRQAVRYRLLPFVW